MRGGLIERNRIRRAFSRHCGGGDLTAEVAKRLIARLDEIAPQPKWIVDVGGDGGAVRTRFPSARILAADFALPRLLPQPRVFRTQADAMQLPVRDSAADMVWSNLCLEWTDIRRAFSEAARILRPHSGLLIFSMLGRDTLRGGTHGVRRCGCGRRTVFAGYARHRRYAGRLRFFGNGNGNRKHRFNLPRPEDAMREVQRAGGGAINYSRNGLRGKNRWQRAMKEYRRQFANTDGRIPATYEIIYALSWRKKSPPSEQIIHFAEK